MIIIHTHQLIGTNKPTNPRIIIPTLQIIQPNLLVVVVRSVSKGVNQSDRNALISTGNVGNCTPSVVGVACDGLRILVDDGNDVALQVLQEVVGNIVVENAANRVFIIVERNESIASPSFAKNLGTVKCVFVLDSIDRLTCSDTVCIVGIGVAIKGLELTALFPGQRVTEIKGRVALTYYIKNLY